MDWRATYTPFLQW